jgi:quinoprotein glucose dehydrogenase
MQIRNLGLSLGLVCCIALVYGAAVRAEGIDFEKVNQTELPVHVEKAFSNFQVERPVLIDNAGDGSNRLFIGSQHGKIFVLPNPQTDEEPNVFLDITDRVVYNDNQNEEGLLGLAFHPHFKENGQFFLYYTSKKEPQLSRISRFHVSKDDPNKADPNSEEVLMDIKQPYWNHNGGTLVFGPDNYLYIGLGDGGLRDDPLQSAQDLTTVLGKILRIDVDKKSPGLPYGIPADNPFVKVPGARGETFAYGLRNIWRMSFDKPTGDFYVADVGQDLWEEINLVEMGGNYGWSAREGLHSAKSKKIDKTSPPKDPIWEYPHEVGKSITGGVVYHGTKVPELKGYYLYADYISGRLWALKIDPSTQKVVENRVIYWEQHLPIVTYGTDESGEVYFSTTTSNGIIFKFVSGKE